MMLEHTLLSLMTAKSLFMIWNNCSTTALSDTDFLFANSLLSKAQMDTRDPAESLLFPGDNHNNKNKNKETNTTPLSYYYVSRRDDVHMHAVTFIVITTGVQKNKKKIMRLELLIE